jgi:hypothetical protein
MCLLLPCGGRQFEPIERLVAGAGAGAGVGTGAGVEAGLGTGAGVGTGMGVEARVETSVGVVTMSRVGEGAGVRVPIDCHLALSVVGGSGVWHRGLMRCATAYSAR